MPHIHDKYDFVVTVFIAFKDKVLLVHHPKYNKWVPMGGHIELDEEPEQALMREIDEETGLSVEILADKPNFNDTKFVYAPRYIDVHDAHPPHKHISLVYFARAKNNKYKLSTGHNEIRWLGLADLNDSQYHLDESVKFYCREALKAVKYHQ